MDFKLLSLKEAATMLGKSVPWLRGHIRRGTGPPAKKVSERCIQIRLDDLKRWADGLASVSPPPTRPAAREPKRGKARARSLLRPPRRTAEAR